MTPSHPRQPKRAALLEFVRARRTPDGRLLDAIEAAAVAEERARLRAVVEALDAVECLPIADFPENSIDYGEGVCDERHRVVAAVLALLDEQS